MAKTKKVTVLGDGGWGTTLSILLAKKGYEVCLWGAFEKNIISLHNTRVNKKFLDGIKIPAGVRFSADIGQATSFSDTILIVVPSQYLRNVLRAVKKNISKEKIFLSATKGIEEKSLLRMSEVIAQELGRVGLAVLSGPNISREIAQGMPAASVVASKDKTVRNYFQDVLTSDTFRVYTNDDVIGVELGGSLKNIIAIACGISDGLGFGANAKSALLTRGLVEMGRLGLAMGARPQTFSGISGLGDLATTCWSPHSRNRSIGEQIGRGRKLSAILKKMQMVAEGITTTKAAHDLSRRYGVDMPITKEAYLVLYKNKSPRSAVVDLMKRQKKPEWWK